MPRPLLFLPPLLLLPLLAQAAPKLSAIEPLFGGSAAGQQASRPQLVAADYYLLRKLGALASLPLANLEHHQHQADALAGGPSFEPALDEPRLLSFQRDELLQLSRDEGPSAGPQPAGPPGASLGPVDDLIAAPSLDSGAESAPAATGAPPQLTTVVSSSLQVSVAGPNLQPAAPAAAAAAAAATTTTTTSTGAPAATTTTTGATSAPLAATTTTTTTTAAPSTTTPSTTTTSSPPTTTTTTASPSSTSGPPSVESTTSSAATSTGSPPVAATEVQPVAELSRELGEPNRGQQPPAEAADGAPSPRTQTQTQGQTQSQPQAHEQPPPTAGCDPAKPEAGCPKFVAVPTLEAGPAAANGSRRLTSEFVMVPVDSGPLVADEAPYPTARPAAPVELLRAEHRGAEDAELELDYMIAEPELPAEQPAPSSTSRPPIGRSSSVSVRVESSSSSAASLPSQPPSSSTTTSATTTTTTTTTTTSAPTTSTTTTSTTAAPVSSSTTARARQQLHQLATSTRAPRGRHQSKHRQYFDEPARDLRRRVPGSGSGSAAPLVGPALMDDDEASILTRYHHPGQLTRLAKPAAESRAPPRSPGRAPQLEPARFPARQWARGLQPVAATSTSTSAPPVQRQTRAQPGSARSAAAARTLPAPANTAGSAPGPAGQVSASPVERPAASGDEVMTLIASSPTAAANQTANGSASPPATTSPSSSTSPASTSLPASSSSTAASTTTSTASTPAASTSSSSSSSSSSSQASWSAPAETTSRPAPTAEASVAAAAAASVSAAAAELGPGELELLERELAADLDRPQASSARPAANTYSRPAASPGQRRLATPAAAPARQQAKPAPKRAPTRRPQQPAPKPAESEPDSGMWRPDTADSGAGSGDESAGSGGGQLLPGRPGVDYPTHWQVPKTAFDCRNYEQSGFYADVDTDCQAYHSCHKGRGGRHTFLCPNGTLFSQELLTCDWWYNVECSASRLYLSAGGGGGGGGGGGDGAEPNPAVGAGSLD